MSLICLSFGSGGLLKLVKAQLRVEQCQFVLWFYRIVSGIGQQLLAITRVVGDPNKLGI